MILNCLTLPCQAAWRLIQDPTSLSARILKAVYFPEADLLSASLGSSPSQIWRAIVEGRDTLALGLIKRIGSGDNTNIWADNWLSRDFKLRPIYPRSDEPPVLVSELINASTGTWDRFKLEEHFIAMDQEVIMNIPLSTRVQEDFWSWHYENTGVFTVRSAYRMLVGIKNQRGDWIE